MKKKVLFTATVDSHIELFHVPYLKYFKEKGYEVHVATNGEDMIPYCDKKIKISFERSPFKLNNLKAIRQLKKVINTEEYDIVHCHTPMGGAVTRLAAKKARKKVNTKVIYTAHGFHFYKGAPLINWIIYYPVEKFLSRYTDTLITINKEDYDFAKKHLKKCKNIYLTNGVGIPDSKISVKLTEKEKDNLRKELEINKNDFVITYVAELNKNKNQMMLINTVKKLSKRYNNIKLLLVGSGNYNYNYYKYIYDNNLQTNIKLLGYREDVGNILNISNMGVSTSKREGLPLNVLEYIFYSLPVVLTKNRGHKAILTNNIHGYLVDVNDENALYHKICYVIDHYDEEKKKSKENLNEVNKYLFKNVIKEMDKIYRGEDND